MNRVAFGILSAGVVVAQAACSSSGGSSSVDGPSTSEVSVSLVSGALNNTNGSAVAMRSAEPPRSSPLDRVLDALNPIGTASAAEWTCTGGSLSPSFAGPGSYEFTPRTCSVTWDNGKTASSAWSAPAISKCSSNQPKGKARRFGFAPAWRDSGPRGGPSSIGFFRATTGSRAFRSTTRARLRASSACVWPKRWRRASDEHSSPCRGLPPPAKFHRAERPGTNECAGRCGYGSRAAWAI